MFEHAPSGSPSVVFAKALKKVAKIGGFYNSDDQIAAMVIFNTPASLSCYVWMKDYFNIVGDSIPNLDGQIYLEPTEKQSIWKEYYVDMMLSGRLVLQFDSFRVCGAYAINMCKYENLRL